MAVDMFLKLGDIKGESADSKHAGEIDVLAWSWSLQQPGNIQQRGGEGAGKVDVHDLSVTKYIDRASPGLMLACCDGQHFKEALLTVRKAMKAPLEFLKITMKEVLVSSVSLGGNAGGQDRLSETITLKFGEFRTLYTVQNRDGSAGAAVEAGWNIQENVKT